MLISAVSVSYNGMRYVEYNNKKISFITHD
jgi:hypothetical protein